MLKRQGGPSVDGDKGDGMSWDGYRSVLYGQGLFVRLYPLLPNVVIVIWRVARENHSLDLLGHIFPYSLEIQRDGLFLFRVFVGNGIDKSFSLFVGCENDVQNANLLLSVSHLLDAFFRWHHV